MDLIINRAFVCVLLLSIGGFIASSIYLLSEKLIFRITSARFMVFINTVVLLSFVIPFYFPVSILDGSEYCFTHYDLVILEGADLCSNFAAYWRSTFPFTDCIDHIWFVGVLLFFITKAILYVYTISRIKGKSFQIESDIWLEIFENIRKEQPKQDVLLVGSNDTQSPFTVGIRQKYIVIPAIMINTLDTEEINFILRHEYCHALRNDVARKVLILVFSCLNWFNPLYFLLKENLSTWIEIACDEAVTENLDERQRKKYASLIIKSLELENTAHRSHFYCVYYSETSIKNYKRRILEVLRGKKNVAAYGKAVAISLAVISLVCSNIVAKEADIPVNMFFSDQAVIFDANDFEIVSLPAEE